MPGRKMTATISKPMIANAIAYILRELIEDVRRPTSIRIDTLHPVARCAGVILLSWTQDHAA